jgi:hypothetical protein
LRCVASKGLRDAPRSGRQPKRRRCAPQGADTGLSTTRRSESLDRPHAGCGVGTACEHGSCDAIGVHHPMQRRRISNPGSVVSKPRHAVVDRDNCFHTCDPRVFVARASLQPLWARRGTAKLRSTAQFSAPVSFASVESKLPSVLSRTASSIASLTSF